MEWSGNILEWTGLKLNDAVTVTQDRLTWTKSYRPPIPGVHRHSGGPPFRGSGLRLGLGLTLADLRNGGPPESTKFVLDHYGH